jgi:hypothetical protein
MLPGLVPSLLPIVLGVLISTHTIVSRLAVGAAEGSPLVVARRGRRWSETPISR